VEKPPIWNLSKEHIHTFLQPEVKVKPNVIWSTILKRMFATVCWPCFLSDQFYVNQSHFIYQLAVPGMRCNATRKARPAQPSDDRWRGVVVVMLVATSVEAGGGYLQVPTSGGKVTNVVHKMECW
jgi:hypothetical protein